jgi:small subunit ribosomal protein S2
MELLIPKSEYIKYRINKGGLEKNKKLERFISWKTDDGRNIFNIQELDNRLRVAAKFLFNKDIVVIPTKLDEKYTKRFCEILGFKYIPHYKASIFSNPLNKEFYEPDIVFLTNIEQYRNVVEEANLNRIPVVCFCNTNSNISGVDLIIPLNTTSKKAIAVALWLILNEIKKLKKEKEISLEEFINTT